MRDDLSYRSVVHVCLKILGLPDTVDTRHRRHDNHIPTTGHQRRGSAEPQLLNVLIHGEVLLDIGVRGRDKCLGLVVVVIRDEIFDEVIGKKLLEFPVKLGRKGLVMTNDEGWPIGFCNDVGNGKSLARAGHTE